MKIPTKLEIYELHESLVQGKHSARFLDLVWTHGEIVAEIAKQFIENLREQNVFVNEELVTAGALMHDIGVYFVEFEDLNPDSTNKYICHGTIGMAKALEVGISMELARFCGHHTGVGITKNDIETMDLPLEHKDFIPVTIEEEIVAYSDRFHSKDPRFLSYEEIEQQMSKIGEDKKYILERYKTKFGLPCLSPIKEKYKDWENDFNLFFKTLPR